MGRLYEHKSAPCAKAPFEACPKRKHVKGFKQTRLHNTLCKMRSRSKLSQYRIAIMVTSRFADRQLQVRQRPRPTLQTTICMEGNGLDVLQGSARCKRKSPSQRCRVLTCREVAKQATICQTKDSTMKPSVKCKSEAEAPSSARQKDGTW